MNLINRDNSPENKENEKIILHRGWPHKWPHNDYASVLAPTLPHWEDSASSTTAGRNRY